MNTPIIRLSIDSMKQTVLAALTEYQAQVDADIQAALEECCTPEHLREVLHEETRRTLDAVIREEVESFFRYGEGRKVVAEAVKTKLLKKESWSPLDEV